MIDSISSGLIETKIREFSKCSKIPRESLSLCYSEDSTLVKLVFTGSLGGNHMLIKPSTMDEFSSSIFSMTMGILAARYAATDSKYTDLQNKCSV